MYKTSFLRKNYNHLLSNKKVSVYKIKFVSKFYILLPSTISQAHILIDCKEYKKMYNKYYHVKKKNHHAVGECTCLSNNRLYKKKKTMPNSYRQNLKQY